MIVFRTLASTRKLLRRWPAAGSLRSTRRALVSRRLSRSVSASVHVIIPLFLALLICIACCTQRERRDPSVNFTRTSQRIQPRVSTVHTVISEAIASVPIEPVPQPAPPTKPELDVVGDGRLSYHFALQKYAIAQLRGRDEATARALRRRLSAGWTELGFVPFALISYQAATMSSAGSTRLAKIRVDRADVWSPQWSTLFGTVAVQCGPGYARFRVITTGTTSQQAPPDVVDTKSPAQRARKAAVVAKLCAL